ncbi:ABC transporter permease subunit [Cellulomonas fimi]|uniref:ABC transporter permease subunit n=1 Tax=Cellulomonas fimi TaxID=1708 RepID=UPI002358E5F4|nr:ABC transporter permease subunit [Cellulomonas fimi]
MTRLLHAELVRARSRPFVWFVSAGVVLGVLGLVLSGWWDSRPPSAAEVAAADEAYRTDLAAWQERVAPCDDDDPSVHPDLPPAEATARCTSRPPVPAQYQEVRPDVATLLVERLPSTGLMITLACLMVGVGLVTAEFASGSMGTWLTFAPRRGRVFVSKLLAGAVAAVPCVATALVTLVVGLLAVGVVNGLAIGTPVAGWAGVGAVAGRWLATGPAFAAIGVGLAFALRHATAVTGIAVWWVAATESALPLVLPESRWLPLSTNVTAWTAGSAQYVVPSCVPDPARAGKELCDLVVHAVPMGQGGLVVLVVVATAVAGGWLSFRLRDVA